MKQVEHFVHEKGLQDKVDLFKRAAVLAQNPNDFETQPDLSEEEKEHIRRETTREFIIDLRFNSSHVSLTPES